MLAEFFEAALWKSKAKLCISEVENGAGRAWAGGLGVGVISGLSLEQGLVESIAGAVYHTVGGLRAQPQNSDERPFKEITRSGIRDTH